MTIQQHCIALDHPEAWKRALTGIPHSFGHTWENCYAMSLTSGHRTYLYCLEHEETRIVCPLAEREYNGALDIVKPFGFSGFVGHGNWEEFQHHWKQFTRERGYVCSYLGINPVFDHGASFNPAELFQYDTVHLLDLTLDDAELWRNLSTNRKRQLRDWQQVSGNLVFQQEQLVDFFLAHHREFFSRKGADQCYHFSDETLSFLFDLDNVVLVGIGGSRGIEAVSVFAYTADLGEYLFNVSLPEGRDHSVPLIWFGVNHLKRLGIPLLNLGGGRGGVGESKRRYGGRELPLRCIKQVYDQHRYRLLCQKAGVDPDTASGYFPAYRKALLHDGKEN